MFKKPPHLTRPTWIEVNTSDLQQNVRHVMTHAGARRLIAVVKADAYGHGMVPVAEALLAIGVTDFAVATIAEGQALRVALGDRAATILLLGVQTATQAAAMAAAQLTCAVGDAAWLEEAVTYLSAEQQLAIHLTLDTGMGRMGARDLPSLQSLQKAVTALPQCQVTGVFTHFATADDTNDDYYAQQVAQFMQLVTAAGLSTDLCHLANTGSALWHADEILTETIRIGSGIYGFNPAGGSKTTQVPLTNALSLRTTIGACRRLKAGESVSYGATYTADTDQWLATLPIGYADGYRRALQGMTVLVAGERATVVGRVTMDQILVRLPQSYPVGTPVTLIGRDGDDAITVEMVADYAGTVPHDILTGLGQRIPRFYTTSTP